MKDFHLLRGEAIGLVHPAVDSHTLGVSSIAQLLEECGFRTAVAGSEICEAAQTPGSPRNMALLKDWIREERLSHLGFSYRLDPESGARTFARLVASMRQNRLLSEAHGPVRGLFFAGLPRACELVQQEFAGRVRTFRGDETPQEALVRMGVPLAYIPREVAAGEQYEQDRLAFGARLLASEAHSSVAPVDRAGSKHFGTRRETLLARYSHGTAHGLPPLMRAHVGPYQTDRRLAVTEFLAWCERLARSGYLDILSIGSSQLTQSHFGKDWGDRPNGGGVPIQNEEEYRQVYQASRPMLVRTYAGTNDLPQQARIHEEALNIAWHALSFWWFSKIDGRGPLSVRENLRQHIETLKYIKTTGKPFEPNIPHHFAFRGADDATYVASGVIAAKVAKQTGIRVLILQNMLNTPRSTSGLQDVAKARVMLSFVRSLEDRSFKVIYQPRAGLDYFSPDQDKAKLQLAAASAMMDDVEPQDASSPGVIHVVSYSEGSELANPAVIDESIQITRAAIYGYRQLRTAGDSPLASHSAELQERITRLTEEVAMVIAAIEANIADPYSPEGLYRIFAAGFLPVPNLWECRDEFEHAVNWRSRPIRGSVTIVDAANRPIRVEDRLAVAVANARSAKHLEPSTILTQIA